MIAKAHRAARLAAALLLVAAPVAAADPADVLGEHLGELTPAIVQLFTLVTVVAIVPSLLVMVTSFSKFVVVFSVLRSALGLQQAPPNMVIVGLSLFLTLFVMQPTLERAWSEGVSPFLDGGSAPVEAFGRTAEPFRTFMTANVREKDLLLFEELAAGRASKPDGTPAPAPAPSAASGAAPGVAPEVRPPLTVLIPAFMTSELRKAFTTAFLLFVPFLVIEMIVSSVLMAMGMMMLPPVVISLPFKLIFFVLVDGWWLLSGSLVRSYS